ncbi:hypothetical protein [Streptomyces venezuelae]|uniref:hypothetical protein n=1 Tax=Streptomyces venezuelae TaxID=54571 RepID=UPI0013839D6D|nr:hypothetical protein [Streptomyces venezuelae]MYZ19612.1 hypothetical protein [Streptomyces sp. SID337]
MTNPSLTAPHTDPLPPGAGPSLSPRPRPRPHSQEQRLLAPALARMLPGADVPSAPGTVRAAFALWLTAAAAGVFLTAAEGLPLLPFLPLHMAWFAAAVLVAVRMRRGARWARWVLVCGLGATGAPSLTAWAGGGVAGWPPDVADVVAGAGGALHLASALTATVLMFRPAANAWFRAVRHR